MTEKQTPPQAAISAKKGEYVQNGTDPSVREGTQPQPREFTEPLERALPEDKPTAPVQQGTDPVTQSAATLKEPPQVKRPVVKSCVAEEPERTEPRLREETLPLPKPDVIRNSHPDTGQGQAVAANPKGTKGSRRRRDGARDRLPEKAPPAVVQGNKKFLEYKASKGDVDCRQILGIGTEPELKEAPQLDSQADFLYLLSPQPHEFDPESHLVVDYWRARLLETTQKKSSIIKPQQNTDPVASKINQVQFKEGAGEPGRNAHYTRMAFPDDVNKIIDTVGPWILHCGLGIEGLLTFMLQTAIEYNAYTSSNLTLPTFEDINTLLRDSPEPNQGKALFATQIMEVVKSRILTYLQDSAKEKAPTKPFFFQLALELKHDRHRNLAGRMAKLHLDAGDSPLPVEDYSSGLENQDYPPPSFGVMLSRVVAAMLVANGRAMGLGSSIEVRACTFKGEVVHICPSAEDDAAEPQGLVDIFCCSQRNAQKEAPKPPLETASYGFLWASIPSAVDRMAKKMECCTTYDSLPMKEGFPQTENTPAYFRPESRIVTCEHRYTVGTEEDPKSMVSKTVQNVCKDSNLVIYQTHPRTKRGNEPKDRAGFTSKVVFKDPSAPDGVVTIDPWEDRDREACTSKKAAEHLAANTFLDWFHRQKRFQATQVSDWKKLDDMLSGEPRMEIQVDNTHEVGTNSGFHSRITLWNERREKLAEVDTQTLLGKDQKFTDLKRAEEKVVSVMLERVERLIKEHRIRPSRKKVAPLTTRSVEEEKKAQTQAQIPSGIRKPLATADARNDTKPAQLTQPCQMTQPTQSHGGPAQRSAADIFYSQMSFRSPKVEGQNGTEEVPRKGTIPLPHQQNPNITRFEEALRGLSNPTLNDYA